MSSIMLTVFQLLKNVLPSVASGKMTLDRAKFVKSLSPDRGCLFRLSTRSFPDTAGAFYIGDNLNASKRLWDSNKTCNTAVKQTCFIQERL